MNAVKDAALRLKAALMLVPGIGSFVYTDPGAEVQRPGLVIGPPSLQFATFNDEVGPVPTNARFTVFAVVDADQYAVEKLWDLVPEVVAAVEVHTDGCLADGAEATPASYPVGSSDMPAYAIPIDMPLEGR